MSHLRHSYVALLMLFGLAVASADEHHSINMIYQRVADAYQQLDSQALLDVYADTGIFIHGHEQVVLVGADAIVDYFERFMSDIRAQGESLEISFRLVDRSCANSICADVGWYRLEHTDKYRVRHVSYGKFLTTPMKSADGVWRISADVDAGADEAQWLAAEPSDSLYYHLIEGSERGTTAIAP